MGALIQRIAQPFGGSGWQGKLGQRSLSDIQADPVRQGMERWAFLSTQKRGQPIRQLHPLHQQGGCWCPRRVRSQQDQAVPTQVLLGTSESAILLPFGFCVPSRSM